MTTTWRWLVLALLASLLAGCGPDPRTQLEALPPLNLEPFEEHVARRLSAERARIERLLETEGTGEPELAEAFGELGRLAFASELIDVALVCNRNAGLLAPRDPRWPSYVGHLERFAGDREHSAEGFERALELDPDNPMAAERIETMRTQSE